MTNTTDNTNVSQIATPADSTEVVEKLSLPKRAKNFVVKHKAPIIVGALSFGGGVLAGRGSKTAPSIDFYEPTEASLYEAEVALEEMGIPVTTED